MLSNILYFKQFNKKNTNLVIVLSKLAELNTIILPFEISKILKNKNIVTNLNKKKYTETFIESQKLRIYFDVKIFLIERSDISAIRAGSNLYMKFSHISKKDISFIFSNYSEDNLLNLPKLFDEFSLQRHIPIKKITLHTHQQKNQK